MLRGAVKSHPDRCAATLADVPAARQRQGEGPFAPPGPGSRDARIDLKLLQWRALRAAEAAEPARARLAGLDPAERPDLWAGTVQDGVARGFAVALEEACSLGPPAPAPPGAPDDPGHLQVLAGRDLRRHKDLLVAAGSARVRFSRKQGLLFVDRTVDAHSVNCLRFEAREDRGTLDGFEPGGDRPRLFSAQFLQPQRYTTAPGFAELRLAGRLGRRQNGWDCELVCTATADRPRVRLALRLDNRQRDQRLRARFLGFQRAWIHHECTDVGEIVANDAGGFVAFTLVRAVGALLVDGAPVPTPAAQCRYALEHVFWLGA